MSKAITLTIDESGIATATIDVVGQSMNIQSLALTEELCEVVTTISEDDRIKAVILTSGKKDFLAGGDLNALGKVASNPPASRVVLKEALAKFPRALRKLETCGKPIVAAINGTALGGGLEFTLGCHHRIVSDHPKIKLGLPEIQVGLIPGGGGTQRLCRLIGARDALTMMMNGLPVTAQKALKMGIIDQIVPAEDLLTAARNWLLDSPKAVQPWDEKYFKCPGAIDHLDPDFRGTFFASLGMVQKATQNNYPAASALLSCVFEGAPMDIDAGLEIESRYFTSLFYSPVAGNMVRSLFLNKQAADKLSSRPEGFEVAKFDEIAVLGAGMMGAGIAYEAARVGCKVFLLDRDMESAERGKAYSAKILDKLVSRGKITSDKAQEHLARIIPTSEYAALENCGLVVEAVFEDPKIKGAVIAQLEAVISEDTIIATNTSTLRIEMLAQNSQRPANFIGLHFFSPVNRMPLVEVIKGAETSPKTLAKALDFVQKISKTPIIVNDAWGFYTSRCFGTFTDEGMSMLEEGVAPALIENAARQCGMPVGPLAVQDEVSQDLSYTVFKALRTMMGDDFKMSAAVRINTDMVEKYDRKGRKNGKGFYDYLEGGGKQLWPDLVMHYPSQEQQPDVGVLKQRLLYRQALEAARCLDESVLETAADGDLGAIFGWGFPQYTGGPLSLIDTVGVEAFVAACDEFAATLGDRFNVPELLRRMAKEGQKFYPIASS